MHHSNTDELITRASQDKENFALRSTMYKRWRSDVLTAQSLLSLLTVGIVLLCLVQSCWTELQDSKDGVSRHSTSALLTSESEMRSTRSLCTATSVNTETCGARSSPLLLTSECGRLSIDSSRTQRRTRYNSNLNINGLQTHASGGTAPHSTKSHTKPSGQCEWIVDPVGFTSVFVNFTRFNVVDSVSTTSDCASEGVTLAADWKGERWCGATPADAVCIGYPCGRSATLHGERYHYKLPLRIYLTISNDNSNDGGTSSAPRPGAGGPGDGDDIASEFGFTMHWEGSMTTAPRGPLPVPESEREALRDFFDSTQGDNQWFDTSYWFLDGLSPCKWEGLSCTKTIDNDVNDGNGQYHIRSIHLVENGLVGTVPAALSRLTYLYSIQLSRNKLTGVTPFSCPQLRNGDFRDNAIPHFPEWLVLCPRIIRILMDGNQLEPMTFQWDSTTSSPILSLSIANCGLTHLPLEKMLGFTDLRQLRAQGNMLATLPTAIGQLLALSHLELSNNLLPKLPTEIGQLQQ